MRPAAVADPWSRADRNLGILTRGTLLPREQKFRNCVRHLVLSNSISDLDAETLTAESVSQGRCGRHTPRIIEADRRPNVGTLGHSRFAQRRRFLKR